MENRNFYNQILTEHNLHPEHKHDLADANLVLEGVNPSWDEAAALQDVAHMPARVKCAVLGWHTMEEMFDLDKQQDAKQ